MSRAADCGGVAISRNFPPDAVFRGGAAVLRNFRHDAVCQYFPHAVWQNFGGFHGGVCQNFPTRGEASLTVAPASASEAAAVFGGEDHGRSCRTAGRWS